MYTSIGSSASTIATLELKMQIVPFNKFPPADSNFENFLVDDSNSNSCLEARQFLQSLKDSPSALFISGPIGCGKTHLACSIANVALNTSLVSSVVHMSSPKIETVEIPSGCDLLILEVGICDAQLEQTLGLLVKNGISIIVTSEKFNRTIFSDYRHAEILTPSLGFLKKCFDQFQIDLGLEQESIKNEDLALNSISVRAIKGLAHKGHLIKSLQI